MVLQEALTLVSPMACDAGIQLVELPMLAADSGIVADRQRLVQVLLNLLSNAIKYNRPQGQVHIEVRVHQQRIAVSVCDTARALRLIGRTNCSNRSSAWRPIRTLKAPASAWR